MAVFTKTFEQSSLLSLHNILKRLRILRKCQTEIVKTSVETKEVLSQRLPALRRIRTGNGRKNKIEIKK